MDAQHPSILQSCRSCRRLKRRCTKELPKCALCTRVGRDCEYPELLLASPDSTPTGTESSANGRNQVRVRARHDHQYLSASIASSPSIQYEENNTAQRDGAGLAPKESAWFLDSVAMRGRQHLLQQTQLEWSQLPVTLPSLTSAEAYEILSHHRESTHTWLPCISLKRWTRQLALRDVLTAADQNATLYAMKLMNCQLSATTLEKRSSVLTAVEACEAGGNCSTNLLAARILVAFWELGQGLLPDAYYSLSRAARTCYAMGLHDKAKATQRLPKADSWTEVEERRRLWWAVIILDRYVHAGFRFRPLCIPTISPQEIIPADDASWDEGVMAVNPLLVMSIEAATVVAPFARLCQAAHLLGGVCQHVNEHPVAEEADLHFQEAYQLSRAALALLTMLEEEQRSSNQPQGLLSARALCFSALLLLYDVHSCVEKDEIDSCGSNRGLRLDSQQMAIDGMQNISTRVCDFANEIRTDPRHEGSGPSSLVLNCIYSAAGVYAWYRRERGNELDLKKFHMLQSLLQDLRRRWRVAESYLWLLEGTENTYNGSCYQ